MSEPIEPETEAPLNSDGVDSARPADQCHESGGDEPAPAEEQDYEVMRLAEFNAVLSPLLAAAMRAALDTMGIQGIPAIGSAVGMTVQPYIKQMREVDLTNAPRQIADWFAACVKISEYVQHIRNQQAGRIIVP